MNRSFRWPLGNRHAVTTPPEETELFDLDSSVFQRQLFSLEKEQAWAILKALRKLTVIGWRPGA